MEKYIEIVLSETEELLSELFSYTKEIRDSALTSLDKHIAHTINQTLSRDGYFGAYAQVIKQDSSLVLKIFSPHHDLNDYKEYIPRYINAGKIALSIYTENKEEVINVGKNKIRFLLPFGLSMLKSKSIQLLHFPPLSTFVYQDYLYSPTNHRWENLLAYNHLTHVNFSELECIVDCVPLAAPGDDSKEIEPFNNLFTPYVKEMLKARLSFSGTTTQPVVAYGGPVREWLEKSFSDVIAEKLEPLSLIELNLTNGDFKTPVLCANHPSKYLYYTDKKKSDFNTKKEIMTQDLIAAGWQARMAFHTNDSAQKILQEMKNKWINNPKVLNIMKQEDKAYGYLL